jgi:uncharacterized membrane protein YeaQ/YmgE (transglycosylase-associated protein family)
MRIFSTIVLGIIGSIVVGAGTHMLSGPKNDRYDPVGLIFSTLGAILILFICYYAEGSSPPGQPFLGRR